MLTNNNFTDLCCRNIIATFQGNVLKAVLPLLLFLCFQNAMIAQNELHIKGAVLKIQKNAIIHVGGDLHIDDNGAGAGNLGQLKNDGTIQVRGDFVFESDNIEQVTDVSSINGIVEMKNYHATWNANTTLDNSAQRITVKDGAIASGAAAFNILQIENEDRSIGSGDEDNYVDIQYTGTGEITVEISEDLVFNNNSRIRTDYDGNFTSDDGNTYSNTLYISNTDADAISGYSTTAGDDVKYVEGRLSREVTGTATYHFPVGLAPGFVDGGTNDGMEAFELDINGAATQTISSYVNDGEQGLATPFLYCDIGQDPGAGSDHFSDCNGGPDGIQDYLFLENKQTHEWIVNSTGGAITSYDIEVFPGPDLDNTAGYANGTCGGTDYYTRFLVKNGLLDAPIISAPHPFNLAHFPDGYAICPPDSLSASNSLTGQTSFSTFRIHSASNNTTLLPVELVSFEANPINNSYIKVSWVTASEVNNDYFEIQRSVDGITWEVLGTEEGHGTTNDVHSYSFDDFNAQRGITYLYRLRQIDFDGTFAFSDIDDATLNAGTAGLEISPVWPNPGIANGTASFTVTSGKDRQFDFTLYDMLGKLVKKGTFAVTGNGVSHLVEIKLQDFTAGNYLLTVWDDEAIHYDKLMVVR